MTEAEELSRLNEGARYQVKLLPIKSLTLWLMFTARKEAVYDFELPITLLGYGFSVAGDCCKRRRTEKSARSNVIVVATLNRNTLDLLPSEPAMLQHIPYLDICKP